MTKTQLEGLTAKLARLLTIVQAAGSFAILLFFAAGFGFVTPAKTLAQLHRADSLMTLRVDTLRRDQDANVHAVQTILLIECLSAKKDVLDRVDCRAVSRLNTIK